MTPTPAARDDMMSHPSSSLTKGPGHGGAGQSLSVAANRLGVGVAARDAWFIGSLEQLFAASGHYHLCAACPDIPTLLNQLDDRTPKIAIVTCGSETDGFFALLQRQKHKLGNIRTIVRYQRLRAGLVRDAIEAGAWGCFAADDAPEIVLGILNSIANGRTSFPFVDFSMLKQDPFEQLTRRERDVLQALSNGWSNLQISSRLGISENTVKYHLKLIFGKLGVTSRTAAIAQFLQWSSE